MSKRSVDGSAKDTCHVSQVLLPRAEHAVLARFSQRLGMPFSTFARAAMRLAHADPTIRGALVQVYDQICAEQRGERAPAFPEVKLEGSDVG
jgi:hypothetical protein